MVQLHHEAPGGKSTSPTHTRNQNQLQWQAFRALKRIQTHKTSISNYEYATRGFQDILQIVWIRYVVTTFDSFHRATKDKLLAPCGPQNQLWDKHCGRKTNDFQLHRRRSNGSCHTAGYGNGCLHHPSTNRHAYGIRYVHFRILLVSLLIQSFINKFISSKIAS